MSAKIINSEWQIKDSNETDGYYINHPVTDADAVLFSASGMAATNVQDAIVEVKNAIPSPDTNTYVKETVTDASDNSSSIYNHGDAINLQVYDENFNEASINIDVSSGISLMLSNDNAFSKIDMTDNVEIQASQMLLSKDAGSTWSEIATKDDIPAAVRYDTNAQGLSSTQKSNARTNIGAGTSNFSGSYNDLSNKPSIPAVKYRHNVILKYGSSGYSLSFSFRNTTASAYTTVAQVFAALWDLGYDGTNYSTRFLNACGYFWGYDALGVAALGATSGSTRVRYRSASDTSTVYCEQQYYTLVQDFVVTD